MNAEFIEKIEDYLAGRIDRQALQDFAQGQGVTDLEEEIQWVRDTQTAVAAAGLRDQLRAALAEASPKAERTARIRYLRPLLAAAATVAIVIAAFFGWRSTQPSGLYRQFEYVDPGLPSLMSASDDYQLYNALTYYSEGNYRQAAAELEGLQTTYPGNDTLAFYLGASRLYRGNGAAAVEALEPVADRPDSEFRERAEWLLVLAALREKDTAAGATRLETILNNRQHPFYDEALQLRAEWLNE